MFYDLTYGNGQATAISSVWSNINFSHLSYEMTVNSYKHTTHILNGKSLDFFLLLLKLIFDEKVNKMRKVCCYLMPLAFCLIILILNTTVMCAPALLLCFFQNEIWLLVCVLWKLYKYSQQFFFFQTFKNKNRYILFGLLPSTYFTLLFLPCHHFSSF